MWDTSVVSSNSRLGIQASQFAHQAPPVGSNPFVVSTNNLIIPIDCCFDAVVVAANRFIVFRYGLVALLLCLPEFAAQLRGRESARHG